MRIAYFHFTPVLGGAERFLAEIVAGAQEAQHQTVVLSPQRFLLDFVKESAPGAEVVHVPLPDLPSAGAPSSTVATLVRKLPEVRQSLRRARATLLHVNNGGYPGSDYCRLAVLAAPLARIPVRVMSVHNIPLPRDDSQPQLQALVDRRIWRSLDAVHASSAFVEGALREVRGMPPEICAHIPYGVSEPPAEAARARRVVSSSRLVVGMVAASGEPRKGHVVLLEALAEAGPQVSAVIVGAHPGAAFLAQIDRLGLADRVELVGPVRSAEVAGHVADADLLVVPSTAAESLPLVILEAMAVGKSVFASRLAGIPEAVVDGETGRLFSPGDAGELADLLREACADPGRLEEMGRAGHERWRQKYTSDEMVASMLALYDRLEAREPLQCTSD